MHLTYPFLGSPGRTSWTAVLDAVRLGPDDDVAEVTAGQVRALVQRLIAAGQWHGGDPDVLVVFDSGYDLARLAFLFSDLPVEVVGRIRADRILRMPAPPREPGSQGRPLKHGRDGSLTVTRGLTRRRSRRPTRPATAPPSLSAETGGARG